MKMLNVESVELADQLSRVMGPMEWFVGGRIAGSGLCVSTHWPKFDDETANQIAGELNAVLTPYVIKAREELKQRLVEAL